MKPRQQAVRELNAEGYVLKRSGGNHDIYFNAALRCAIPLKRHDFDEDDLRYILKEIRSNSRQRGE